MDINNLDENKLFFSIGEVAKIFNVNTSLIRFWETEFKQISPQKTKAGKRQFTKKDLKNFQLIYELVKVKGFTLQGAKDSLKQNKSYLLKQLEIKARLKVVKRNLEGLLDQE